MSELQPTHFCQFQTHNKIYIFWFKVKLLHNKPTVWIVPSTLEDNGKVDYAT